MICPNMRAAQIYVRRPTQDTIDRLVRAALAERRIDLVLWHRRLTAAGAEVHVVDSQAGRLEFWRGEAAGTRVATPTDSIGVARRARCAWAGAGWPRARIEHISERP